MLGLCGKLTIDHFGLGIKVLAGVGHVVQERLGLADVERDHVARGEHHRVDVDRKRRRRHDGRVARAHQGQAHVAETLFRAEAGDHLAIGSQADAVLLPIAGRDFLAQILDAVGNRIAVIARIGERLGEFVDDQRIGRVGRVAHPQVDHVDAGDPLLILELVDLAEHVRRQPVHPVGHLDLGTACPRRGLRFRCAWKHPLKDVARRGANAVGLATRSILAVGRTSAKSGRPIRRWHWRSPCHSKAGQRAIHRFAESDRRPESPDREVWIGFRLGPLLAARAVPVGRRSGRPCGSPAPGCRECGSRRSRRVRGPRRWPPAGWMPRVDVLVRKLSIWASFFSRSKTLATATCVFSSSRIL